LRPHSDALRAAANFSCHAYQHILLNTSVAMEASALRIQQCNPVAIAFVAGISARQFSSSENAGKADTNNEKEIDANNIGHSSYRVFRPTVALSLCTSPMVRVRGAIECLSDAIAFRRASLFIGEFEGQAVGSGNGRLLARYLRFNLGDLGKNPIPKDFRRLGIHT
jgi:hypothetical protein